MQHPPAAPAHYCGLTNQHLLLCLAALEDALELLIGDLATSFVSGLLRAYRYRLRTRLFMWRLNNLCTLFTRETLA